MKLSFIEKAEVINGEFYALIYRRLSHGGFWFEDS